MRESMKLFSYPLGCYGWSCWAGKFNLVGMQIRLKVNFIGINLHYFGATLLEQLRLNSSLKIL
jgi:hypothetical protein